MRLPAPPASGLRRRARLRAASPPRRHRRLRVEPLEDRRLLAGFTPGNLVIYQVGDGEQVLQTNRAQPVFLIELSPTDGTRINSLPLPTEAAGDQRRLMASNPSNSPVGAEGHLTRSADGRYLVLTGYDAPAGAVITDVPRVVGRVDSAGTVDTSTTITDAIAGTIRGAASLDGSDFWVVGSQNGVRLVEFGSSGGSSEVSTTFTNLRSVNVFEDQLYVSGNTGTLRLGAVGVGTPKTSGQTIAPLPGIGTTDPNQFFFADLSPSVPGLDTVYVADASFGLRKFTLVGGTWQPSSGIAYTNGGLRGITGSVDGNSVTLYMITGEATGNQVRKFTDAGGYGAALVGTLQPLGFGAHHRAVFRGIAWAPEAGPSVPDDPPEPEPFDPEPVIEAGDQDNDIRVRRVGDNLVVTIDGSQVLNQPAAGTTSLTILGQAGHDTLTIDYASGGFFAAPIRFDGGDPTTAPGDRLVIEGGAFETVTIEHDDASSGTIDLDGTTITFTGLEPVDLAGTTAAKLVIHLPDAEDAGDDTELRIVGGSLIVESLVGRHETTTIGGIASFGTIALNARGGDDTIRLDGSLAAFSGPITIRGGAGDNSLFASAAAVLAPSATVAITESTIAGGPAGPTIGYHEIHVLHVTGTSGDDTFDVQLNAGSDLVEVVIDGAAGDDQFFLDLSTDPFDFANAVAGLARVTLIGGEGNDTFGELPANAPLLPPPNGLVAPVFPLGKGMIQPSATTAIIIEGDIAGSGASPRNATDGNGPGDRLHLDLTIAAVNLNAIALVSTVGAAAAATGFRDLVFRGIEGMHLVDQGLLTRLEMGDLYVRGTDAADVIQFSPAGTPGMVRTRVNGLIVNLPATRKTIAYGRGGNDQIQQSNLPLDAEFYGEAGDDYLAGGVGNDLLVGGPGNDRLLVAGGDNELWGDNLGEHDLPVGGNDYIAGRDGHDVIYGGGGNDTLIGGGGDDILYGGHGNDSLSGGAGNDRLYGGPGNDVISGDDGDDILVGGDGDDRLYGRAGHDILIGGFGADLLMGEAGDDLLIGGLAWRSGTSLDSHSRGDAGDLALQQLLADWTGGNWAVGNLLALLLAIEDDHAPDKLSGGLGTDIAGIGVGDTGDWEGTV